MFWYIDRNAIFLSLRSFSGLDTSPWHVYSLLQHDWPMQCRVSMSCGCCGSRVLQSHRPNESMTSHFGWCFGYMVLQYASPRAFSHWCTAPFSSNWSTSNQWWSWTIAPFAILLFPCPSLFERLAASWNETTISIVSFWPLRDNMLLLWWCSLIGMVASLWHFHSMLSLRKSM